MATGSDVILLVGEQTVCLVRHSVFCGKWKLKLKWKLRLAEHNIVAELKGAERYFYIDLTDMLVVERFFK